MELLPLVCLCLLSCSGDADRVVVEEDSDAVLNCSLSTKEDISGELFVWRKDGQKKKEVFLYDAGNHYNNGLPGQDDQFNGRVSFFQDQLQNGNASIKITRTKMADSETYSCDFPRHQPRQTSIIELVVEQFLRDRTGEKPGAASEPHVKTIHTDKGVMLQCKVRGASPKPRVEWKDSSGNILQTEEPQVTVIGDRYDIVLRAALTKTDNFRCVVTQEEISLQISDEIYAVNDPLLRDITGEKTGLAPKPYISTLRDTKDSSLLLCEARGVPPLTVEWKNAAGNILKSESTPISETGSPSSITLNITVTKTDDYSCVATQKNIIHQVAAVTSVYIPGAASKPHVTTIQTDDGVILQCEVLGASPKPKVEWKDSSGNVLKAEEPQVTESGGSYNIVLRAAVTKTDTFRCVVTQEEISHQTEAETYASVSGLSAGVIAAIVVPSVLFVCVLIILVLQSMGYITLSCKKGSRCFGLYSL